MSARTIAGLHLTSDDGEWVTDDGRWRIGFDEAVTECECPPQLCTHPGGERWYSYWYVWDVQRKDYAPFSHGHDYTSLTRAAQALAQELVT